MKKCFLLLVGGLAAAAVLSAQPRLREDNIPEIIRAMSPEEKACLVVGYNNAYAGYDPGLPGTAGLTFPMPEYGIPSIVMMDGPSGVRLESDWHDGTSHFTTCFPTGLLTAASWDRTVAARVGQGIGEEALDMGADVLLGPGMNLLRNPLNGRNFEYFSEDPVLSGRIAAAYINGLQSVGVGTSAKHFAANSQETNRLDGDSRMSTRALRELYTRGFEICLRESEPWTVMASYNLLNGEYTQESYGLLTQILRKDFGYQGLVVTDWTGKRNTPKQLHAGTDLFMGGARNQTDHILVSLGDGTLEMADLDRAAAQVLKLIVKTPAFRGHKASLQPDLEGHAALVRATAAEGMVLLKNQSTLPLSPCRAALFGVHSYDLIPGGNGAAYVSCRGLSQLDDALREAGFGTDADLDRLYAGYAAFADADIALNHKVHVHVGKAQTPELEITRGLIESAEKRSDMAMITLGRTSGEARDRILNRDFLLQENEVLLVENVCEVFHAAGKKVVVVLNICGPVETASWSYLPDAILCAWLPGEEGGHSIVDVLTGAVNPSGRLPMTFPLDYFDIAGAEDFPYNFISGKANESVVHPERRALPLKNLAYTDYTEDIFVGYRHFLTAGREVAYPFGFGLSYTSFAYSDASVRVQGDRVLASVTVTNTGSVAGKEAVGVYVSAPLGSFAEKPERELKDFAKTRLLAPGECETLSFSFPVRDLASFRSDLSRWEVAKGQYRVCFGAEAGRAQTERTLTISRGRNYGAERACEPR
ncbi:MAG: glycoside hydrolase family 3 C-terminal domain-containing protein [Bacteroidales bacterium]|nr:glycoside hydrolase family 3 C-terminal domain-containing protein [Bacteroidales bacterium]